MYNVIFYQNNQPVFEKTINYGPKAEIDIFEPDEVTSITKAEELLDTWKNSPHHGPVQFDQVLIYLLNQTQEPLQRMSADKFLQKAGIMQDDLTDWGITPKGQRAPAATIA